MKVAVVQMDAGSNKDENIAKAGRFIEKAAQRGAKFVLLPEVFNFRGRLSVQNGLSSITETTKGKSIQILSKIAKSNRIFILAGSIYEKKKRSSKAFNSSVLIGKDGKVLSKYQKINLFDAVIGRKVIQESKTFVGGKKGVVSKVGPFSVGLSICYDLRFPSLYQSYARKGADILCVPSGFTHYTGKAHWEVLLRARAIENLCYVLAPNQIGRDGRGVKCYGHSMIIDPWGKVIARASGNREEIIYGTIDKKAIKNFRNCLPKFKRL